MFALMAVFQRFRTVVWSLVFLLAALFTLGGCGGGSSGKDVTADPPPIDARNLIIATNPTDPLLLIAPLEDGGWVEFHGTRGPLGQPEAVSMLAFISDTGKKTGYIFLDEQGRPTRLFSAEGDSFELTWISSTEVVVSFVSPDGELQVNTNVDLTQINNDDSGFSMNDAIAQFDLTRNVNKGLPEPRDSLLQTLTKSGAPYGYELGVAQQSEGPPLEPNTLTVKVTRCGELVDPNLVVVSVSRSGGAGSGDLSGDLNMYPRRLSRGYYRSSVPVLDREIWNPAERILEWIPSLGTAGAFKDIAAKGVIVCGQLSTAAIGTGMPPHQVKQLTGICQGLFLNFHLVGAFLDGIAGGKSVLEGLIEWSPLNRDYPRHPIEVWAWARIGYEFASSARVVVPPGGAHELHHVEFEGTPSIVSLSLSPPSPTERQGYLATAELGCLPPGTSATFRVEGTDGYVKSVDREFGAYTPSSQFEMRVPGAEGGVQDTISISMLIPQEDSSWLERTRTASLVFRSLSASSLDSSPIFGGMVGTEGGLGLDLGISTAGGAFDGSTLTRGEADTMSRVNPLTGSLGVASDMDGILDETQSGPGAPRGLTAVAGDMTVLLNWDVAEDADEYAVYWSKASGIHPDSARSYEGFLGGVTEPSAMVKDLVNDTEYFFAVTAQSGRKESPPSPEVAAIPGEGELLIANRFQIPAWDAPTVIDVETGLEWQRCALGQSWDGVGCTGSANAYSLEGARQATAALNRPLPSEEPPWRLPEIQELQRLVYCSSGMPAHFLDGRTTGCWGSHGIPTLEPTVFPYGSVASGWFWSSSTHTDGQAWGLDFNRGTAHPYHSSAFSGVRLTRPLAAEVD